MAPDHTKSAKELQALKKTISQHSQDLEVVESALRGFQQSITETTCNLARRVEALEVGNVPMVTRGADCATAHRVIYWGNEPVTGQPEVVTGPTEDLDASFEHLRKHAATQVDPSIAELSELQGEDSSEGFFLTDNLRTVLLNASSHVMRLEKLSKKWQQLQADQDRCGRADSLEETVKTMVSKYLRELSPSERLTDQCQVNYNNCQRPLHVTTSLANLVADDACAIDMGARQHDRSCGKIRTNRESLAGGMQRSTVSSLSSQAEVAVERRRISDQTLLLSSSATSVVLAAQTSWGSVPSVQLPHHIESNAHISSQMLNAMEPAPSTTLRSCTSRDDFCTSSGIATGGSYQSFTVPTQHSISDTSSIIEAPSSRSTMQRPGSAVFQASQAMSVMTPRTYSPAAQSRATLFVPPHAALSKLRCEAPSAGSVQMHMSPRSQGRLLLAPASPCPEVKMATLSNSVATVRVSD